MQQGEMGLWTLESFTSIKLVYACKQMICVPWMLKYNIPLATGFCGCEEV